MKKEITADSDLIAYCGLYCGACPRYLKGKCAGCRESDKLSWCKIRNCNEENGFHNCGDCTLMNFSDCKLNHNFMSRFFSLIFNSDRDACVARIKAVGKEDYAEEMAKRGSQTIPRK